MLTFCLEHYWHISIIWFILSLIIFKVKGVTGNPKQIKKFFEVVHRSPQLSIDIGIFLSASINAIFWPLYLPKHVISSIKYGYFKDI